MEATEARRYRVTGMTCAHCTAAVREEVERVPGVTGATVQLEGGTLAVRGEAIDDGAIRAAVVEAGYEVAP